MVFFLHRSGCLLFFSVCVVVLVSGKSIKNIEQESGKYVILEYIFVRYIIIYEALTQHRRRVPFGDTKNHNTHYKTK